MALTKFFLSPRKISTAQLNRMIFFTNRLSTNIECFISFENSMVRNTGITPQSIVVNEMKNNYYLGKIKAPDIQDFLTKSINYNSEKVGKSSNQRKIKESSIKNTRKNLLQFFNEDGTIKDNIINATYKNEKDEETRL